MVPQLRLRPRATRMALALAIAAVVGGCSSSASVSFDPSGPCTADGKAAGAYPDLEGRVPRILGGRGPTSLDSGRNCTSGNLGTLSGHGLKEVRFAGGVWADDKQAGLTLAVFQAPGLQADWIGEWYEASARAARQTGSIQVTKPTVAGRQANRMDLVNGESSQVAIAWASVQAADVVNVVLAADEPESRIQEAIAAFP